MTNLPTYILAGGRSSRFGADKARAVIDDQPLIVRIAEQVAPIASRLTIIADRRHKYDDLKLATSADLSPNLGPIGGLHTALRDLRDGENWLLLLSCDLVTIRIAWIQTLLTHRDRASAVAFKPDAWQPLLALYHRSIAPVVEAQIARGRRAMRSLLDAADAIAAPTPADWPATLQINTPDDLKRARQA